MKSIENNCCKLLNSTMIDSVIQQSNSPLEYNYSLRKETLLNNIFQYVVSNKSILFEGFIKFRIRNYINFLDEAVDFAVNQFVVDKEYNNFINVIKSYVESSPSNSGTVYLIYDNGESTLLNENNDIIKCDKEKLECNYLSDISFSSNDYTLNSLLFLLPKKLIICLLSQEDEFIFTLKAIFSSRIVFQNHNNSAKI